MGFVLGIEDIQMIVANRYKGTPKVPFKYEDLLEYIRGIKTIVNDLKHKYNGNRKYWLSFWGKF